MGSEQPIADADVEGPIRHKLTVEEFLILDEAGVFGTKHVELIDGEIFVLSPIFIPHARTQQLVAFEFESAVRRLGGSKQCFAPVSALLDDFNLPEADLMVAEPGGDRFMSAKAIRIAVEVSSSSVRHDLVKKARLYAKSGLPEYWVFDVAGRRTVRMHDPVGGEYMERTEFAFGEAVPSATVEGLVVDTSAL